MNGVSQAVFLSYASQDADAARRICDALRNAGSEVWFDQNELRGGDAWDQNIRRQIRDCALLVLIISANTQTRLEGYFRLECKLAEDRSPLMAKGKPFIVPVSVDATTDRGAHVPDAFLAVQWTPLRQAQGGRLEEKALAAFAGRVKSLLGGDPGMRASSLAAIKNTGGAPALPAKVRRGTNWRRPTGSGRTIPKPTRCGCCWKLRAATGERNCRA